MKKVPMILLLILVFTLVMMLAGGEGIRDEASSMILIALLLCYLIQVSSAILYSEKRGKFSDYAVKCKHPRPFPGWG